MVDQVELRRILTGSEIARLHKAKCDAGPELYEVLASLKGLGAESRKRVDAVLAKARTPTTPERSDDE